MANPLLDLKKYGQSIWYDNLNRDLIVTGDLQRLVDDDGITGGTSNPSIFEKAVNGGDHYDRDIERLTREGADLPESTTNSPSPMSSNPPTSSAPPSIAPRAPTATPRSRSRPKSPTTPKPASRPRAGSSKPSTAPTS